MRSIRLAGAVILAGAALMGGPALANVCEAGKLICATTMPVGGYCQCTAHGSAEDGTVVSRPTTRQPVNSTAGGCGSQPNAPGCR